MVLAAFIFGLVVFFFSLLFVVLYVRSNKSIRENQSVLARQREQQLKFQADLQARMELEARKYEEARQTLLKHARSGGGDDPKQRNIEHAA
jgi:hypothetical protein